VAYLHQGRCQEAIAALEEVVATRPDCPLAKSTLGVAYNTAREPLRAIAIFEELLEEQPEQPGHLLNLGYACHDAGFTERAVECLCRVVAKAVPGSSHFQKAQLALGAMESN
jgi:predicted Zn-dependent protease